MAFIPKKKYSVRVRLRQPNYANFLEYYHNNTTNDYFYKILLKHLEDLEISSKIDMKLIKSNFTKEGFYFKNDKTTYYNKNNKICMPDDICDLDAVCDLTISPYDFTNSDKVRLVGLSIVANKITAKKDKD